MTSMANDIATRFWLAATTSHTITVSLATLGGLWATCQLYQLASFTHLNLLHQTTIGRYAARSRDGRPTTWALVTGGSDGIGKGFAEELCQRGFNVILHGRNEKKLDGVKAELERQWPKSEIKIIVFDASSGFKEGSEKLEAVVGEIKALNITVLINNLGGGPFPSYMPLGEHSAARMREFIDVNATFTTDITRLMIPVLAKRSSALVMTVGSFVGAIGAPYVSIYSAVKAYGETLTRALHIEMKAEKLPIEVIHLQVGMVQTGREAARKVSFLIPSSRQLAASALAKVGCGLSVVTPYWPHAVQFNGMMSLPGWLMERMLLNMVSEERKTEQEALKKQ